MTRREMLPLLAMQSIRLPKKIRVVMIGLQGHPGEITGPASSLPDVEITGVWDASEADRRRAAGRGATSSAKAYDNWVEMLDREKPDIAAICNSADQRAAAILEATKRGIPWIAEKPLANEFSELKAIQEALSRNKVAFSMLLPMRFDGQFLALKRAVDGGAVGEVAQIGAQKSYKAGNRPEWMRHRKTYGGTIAWIGVHMIDLMRWASGREFTDVFSMQAQVGNFPGIGEMENTTASVFRLDNKGVGTLHMDYYRPESSPTHGDDRLRLAGTKGVVEYMASTGVTLISEGRKPEVITDLPKGGSVFVDFLKGLYLGEKQTLSHEDILRNSAICLAARESAETGRVVKIERA